MSSIEVTDHHVVYENPMPQVRARHGFFPAMVKLRSGDLLALFALGEAIDAANVTTVVSRSHDQGRTWDFEGPLHERCADHQFCSDYLKPNLLRNGTLIATGYRFYRSDADELIANVETDGMRNGDNLVSFSQDEGRTWSEPQAIPTHRPELVEASGPSIELNNGTILAAGSLFPTWEGNHPSGFVGVLLRSDDHGQTWDDHTHFFRDPAGRYMPSEPRLCEMQEGRVVALVWTTDHVANTNLTNHVTVSHDAGVTWSDPIDTGVEAQASNLMHVRDDLLLTIHSHRERKVELVVRIVNFANDRWRTIEEFTIWNRAPRSQIASYAQMAMNLRFGQPSLLQLDNGELLATHWAMDDGQGKILTHRLRVNV